ncbi:hypothetical protein [Nocardia caishijiensis]|uniref:Uncharacterized protein n=1 Tax=Nocardia caishijiensis TaxID=184756 RepID=A0ABQ6YRW1_9NOCA|nr:hypothetical protein [Nocardia caishijiensis]KAF0848176.1 hypothetical protein FNL39_102324 [Nocardia caishijiensis]
MSDDRSIENADTEITALAKQVATARDKLPLQHDTALYEALSENEIRAERELAEWIRAQRRKQRRLAVVDELAAEKRDRRTGALIRRTDEADARWHRKALAARRRVSSADARLAQLYRRAEWSSRALIGVVLLGMVWAGVNVQHNLVPSGDMSDPLYWLSFGIEAMISIPIIVIMTAATTAARWGRELERGKVIVFELALLGTTVALNAGPHLAAGAWGRAAEYSIAPVMVGVVIWLHAWVSARYAMLIESASVELPGDYSSVDRVNAVATRQDSVSAMDSGHVSGAAVLAGAAMSVNGSGSSQDAALVSKGPADDTGLAAKSSPDAGLADGTQHAHETPPRGATHLGHADALAARATHGTGRDDTVHNSDSRLSNTDSPSARTAHDIGAGDETVYDGDTRLGRADSPIPRVDHYIDARNNETAHDGDGCLGDDAGDKGARLGRSTAHAAETMVDGDARRDFEAAPSDEVTHDESTQHSDAVRNDSHASGSTAAIDNVAPVTGHRTTVRRAVTEKHTAPGTLELIHRAAADHRRNGHTDTNRATPSLRRIPVTAAAQPTPGDSTGTDPVPEATAHADTVARDHNGDTSAPTPAVAQHNSPAPADEPEQLTLTTEPAEQMLLETDPAPITAPTAHVREAEPAARLESPAQNPEPATRIDPLAHKSGPAAQVGSAQEPEPTAQVAPTARKPMSAAQEPLARQSESVESPAEDAEPVAPIALSADSSAGDEPLTALDSAPEEDLLEDNPIDDFDYDDTEVRALARRIATHSPLRLTLEQIEEILELTDQSWSARSIGAEVGVPGKTVTNVVEFARKIRHPYAFTG